MYVPSSGNGMPVHSSQSETGASISIERGAGAAIVAADAFVRSQPRIEVRAVLATPLGIPLDRDQRVLRLQRRAHRRDHAVVPRLGCAPANLGDQQLRDALAAALRAAR